MARGKGQGHKKDPKPRTDLPRTELLEAKDTMRKCSPKKGHRSKKKIANFPRISGVLPKKGHQNFSARSLACSNTAKKKTVMTLAHF